MIVIHGHSQGPFLTGSVRRVLADGAKIAILTFVDTLHAALVFCQKSCCRYFGAILPLLENVGCRMSSPFPLIRARLFLYNIREDGKSRMKLVSRTVDVPLASMQQPVVGDVAKAIAALGPAPKLH